MRRRKRYKLNKKRIIFTILISILLVLVIIYLIKQHSKEETKISSPPKIETKININKEIMKYNIEEIDEEFLEWILNNYGEKTLNKLNKALKEKTYDEKIWHKLTGNSFIVLKDMYNNNYQNQKNIQQYSTNQKEIVLSFIGDVSLADNWYIMPEYDKRNKGINGILSNEVTDILKNSTLTIANSEFTVSNRGEKLENKYYTFRASPNRLKIYEEMGVDLVTLANNHVYDFGKNAFLDMLEAFEEYKIPHIGAGRNIEEAGKPYYFIINGYKIAFLNANRSEKFILTPGATNTTEGVLRCYDPTYFSNIIKETKKQSDFLIALLHWGKEDSHELEEVQKETSKLYFDSGADIIVGTHAHVLQGLDFYKNKIAAYNLGDFIFNNETKDTGIFQVKIDDNYNLKYQFIPAKEENMYTNLLNNEEKKRVLNNIQTWSPNINVKEDGEITQK